MAPWMVITALIVIGFVVLLIAPTVHRRINANSRSAAEQNRVGRARELRDSTDGSVRTFESPARAVNVRDHLLLRGVRSEILSEEGSTVLVFRSEDAEVVDSVLSELGLGS